jgi:hypothetical protein
MSTRARRNVLVRVVPTRGMNAYLLERGAPTRRRKVLVRGENKSCEAKGSCADEPSRRKKSEAEGSRANEPSWRKKLEAEGSRANEHSRRNKSEAEGGRANETNPRNYSGTEKQLE